MSDRYHLKDRPATDRHTVQAYQVTTADSQQWPAWVSASALEGWDGMLTPGRWLLRDFNGAFSVSDDVAFRKYYEPVSG